MRRGSFLEDKLDASEDCHVQGCDAMLSCGTLLTFQRNFGDGDSRLLCIYIKFLVTTWYHIPEDSNLDSCLSEELISCMNIGGSLITL